MHTQDVHLLGAAYGTKLTNRSAFIGPSSGCGFGPLMTQLKHTLATALLRVWRPA